MTEAADRELREALDRVWSSNTITNILESVEQIVVESGGDIKIDPVMYSTMPLEEMENHPGGRMYELLMLKPKSWRPMCKTMLSKSYWRSWVTRSEQGIVNMITGRHRIAGPYGYMRLGMMLGTCMMISGDDLVVESWLRPALPRLKVCPGMDIISCSSAMTKLTKIMYQRGIDISKHSKVTGMIPAMETLMKMSENCYVIVNMDGETKLTMCRLSSDITYTNPLTTLELISRLGSRTGLIESALLVMSMVEELNNIMLTPQERIAVSVLFAFLSMRINAVMETDIIDVIILLRLDWYTSATCSDIRWLKNVIRDPCKYPGVRTDMNVNSILGSIFLRNMSMITPENTGEHGSGTMKMNTDTEVLDWSSK